MVETLGKSTAIYTKIDQLVWIKDDIFIFGLDHSIVIAVRMCAVGLFLLRQWVPVNQDVFVKDYHLI